MNPLEKTIADLVSTNGLRPVLESLQAHCTRVADCNSEPHDEDDEGHYEIVGDAIGELLEDLG